MMTLKLVLFVILELMIPFFCFSQKKINWVVYDQHYQKVAQIRASEVSIVDDLIWYKSGKKYGVMDFEMNRLIPPRYETIHHYPNGMTSVGVGNCYGMVYQGNEILPLEYSNLFLVDSSGYFRAEKGCSEDREAYIISEYAVHDQTGKRIVAGTERDVTDQFYKLTNRDKRKITGSKNVRNRFVIKLMSPDQGYVKKGIYNYKDSLIFSCIKCTISDNVNGFFLINEKIPNGNEMYAVDTSGAIRIKNEYSQLRYDSVNKLYSYAKAKEKGILNNKGHVQFSINRGVSNSIQIISENRFLISMAGPSGKMVSAICDSSGTYLFSPVDDDFQIISSSCLVRKAKAGYLFTDAEGEPVSEVYDSVFSIPDFNYKKMVEGIRFSFVQGPDVHIISPLDHDGFSPLIKTPGYTHYGVIRGDEMGLFIVKTFKSTTPQYSLIAKADDLFVVEKNSHWFTLNNQGELKSYGKVRYINFSGKYIVAGN